MKKLFTVALLGIFTAAMIGCEASASIDDDDYDRDRKVTKTTRIEPDGDRTTKTRVDVD